MKDELINIEKNSIILLGVSSLLSSGWEFLPSNKKDDTMFAISCLIGDYANKIQTVAAEIEVNTY